MNLGKHIRELLPEHDTLIIPGLGAFISTYKPAQINEESGLITPPAKVVYFEPRLKTNDGLLSGKISMDEEIPLTEAYKQLENEREEILYHLDMGEKVILEDMGELFFDEKREIRFNASGKDFLLLDAYGMETLSLENEPEEIPDTNIESEIPAGEPEIEDKSEEKAPVAFAGTAVKEAGYSGKHRNRAWWLLLLLIPLVAGAIYIFTTGTKVPVSTVEVPLIQPPREQIIPPVDTLAADTLPTSDPEQVAATGIITDSTGFIIPDSSMFYLITGSFEEFKNADKYFNRLKKDGYKPFHLGKFGSFYFVGIDVFDNEIMAYGQQYNYLDKFPESGAWIFSPGKKYIPYVEKIDSIYP